MRVLFCLWMAGVVWNHSVVAAMVQQQPKVDEEEWAQRARALAAWHFYTEEGYRVALLNADPHQWYTPQLFQAVKYKEVYEQTFVDTLLWQKGGKALWIFRYGEKSDHARYVGVRRSGWLLTAVSCWLVDSLGRIKDEAEQLLSWIKSNDDGITADRLMEILAYFLSGGDLKEVLVFRGNPFAGRPQRKEEGMREYVVIFSAVPAYTVVRLVYLDSGVKIQQFKVALDGEMRTMR